MKNMTVFEKVIRDCRKAMLNGKPLIVLRTNEMDLIRQIVESDRLVVRLSKDFHMGVDNINIVPTRYLEAGRQTNSRLFKADSTADCMNFNIHYLSDNSLRKFSLDDWNNYGIPAAAVNYTFPSLFIIQYKKPMHENNAMSIWDSANLNSYIDRYLLETENSGIRSSVILIYGKDAAVPSIYGNYAEIIDEPYPEMEEIKECLLNYAPLRSPQKTDAVNSIANELLGIRITEVRRIIHYLESIPDEDNPGRFILDNEKTARKEIQEYKSQVLKKNNLLELVTPEESSLGGMIKFQDWIREQKTSITEASSLMHDVGIAPPKGILLCGIPGCGKSEAVNMVANTLNIPLLKLDIGQLMGKYVGESEHNMIRALKIAEAMSPCILFIDELDKGFSGAGSDGSDSGAFKRMFGTLLGWMQNCKKSCFIFATANDISRLPKEFFRSGRFDCLYSLYMPTAEECVSIFQKRMEKAEKDSDSSIQRKYLFEPECYSDENLKSLLNNIFAAEKRFVTGADITKIVNMSLRRIWSRNNDFEGTVSWSLWRETVINILQETTVYGDSKENIDSIAFCYIRLLKGNFIPASDDPLFTDYRITEQPETGGEHISAFPRYQVTITAKKNCDKYDQTLRDELKPLLERYGSLLEENSIRRMI